MDQASSKLGSEAGIKRPPFIGLLAFLLGILIGMFIPLSRALRKTKAEK